MRQNQHCGFCIGKHNWRLIDTIRGAKSSAIIYSITETAKANNLKVYEYVVHLLTEIPKHEDDTNRDFLDDLLPWFPNLLGLCCHCRCNEYTKRNCLGNRKEGTRRLLPCIEGEQKNAYHEVKEYFTSEGFQKEIMTIDERYLKEIEKTSHSIITRAMKSLLSQLYQTLYIIKLRYLPY